MSFPFSLLMNPPVPTYPEYEALLAEAKRTVPQFVDPRNLNPSGEAIGRRGEDWRIAVLGRLNGSATNGRLTMVEHQLLILADTAGIDPPLPDWIITGREASARHQATLERKWQEARARDVAAWQAALDKATVEVEIRQNTTARVRGNSVGCLGHAVPLADVYSGTRKVRVHPRERALCESETRARPLLLGSPVDEPVTCVRCLEWTPKVRRTREPARAQPVTDDQDVIVVTGVEDRAQLGETLTPVTDAAWEEHVRPVGWFTVNATLDVVDMGDGHVKVLWRCDAGDTPPEPFTMFEASDKVWVKTG